ncbi:DUF2989 domain-containing protein [Vibrio brasiliensis]|uniref:Lipoprotein n=1 Tax=Vibrio brasiliensis LMG 20546 TaxID=945543 RepID=E8LQR5_9VIBR|nr:DUF2989 domain-containing protein [Vibrio brasiliensis]EGA66949.1 hypothetical protein VIBR0546_04539 [Vibrio brasiliensis LMG 20546]MCG9724366.1 DUF2989 domain-containing protein [Vibrio brasiliensis]MCG9750132.1 DUF2989 domain-containing protein [Vibrio brasiliensis]MCG9781447.1 DUF2989 domain-containing protein [Vibrio brasiliensis]
MKLTNVLTLLSASIALSGCFEGNKNTEQLCNDNPALQCERLNVGDGQCRVPRTDLIWHRFEVLKNPSDDNYIKEYMLLAEYKKCLELASQIQPIDQSGLKQRRFDALINSGQDLETIVARLEKSQSPQSLYFLWSQTGSDQARRSFLQLEGTQALESAEMQYALATFYTSRDQAKTRQLLLHALELTKRGGVNTEIFKSLASTTYRLGMKEEAYIWTMVAQRFEVPIASQSELQLLYGFDSSTYQQLDDIAEKVEEMIDSGSFNVSVIPRFK